MKAHSKAKPPRTYDGPFYSWLSVGVFGIFALGLVASLWSMHNGPQAREDEMRKWKSWPSTPGTPISMRIVQDAEATRVLTKGRFDGSAWYEGECLVEYSVSGQRYTVSVPAYQNSDREQIPDNVSACPSYNVHYDPEQPSTAHAFMRAGPP